MKKTSIADLFKTAKSKKQNEVTRAIRKYCLNLNTDDENEMQEIHQNIVNHFELTSNDIHFNLDFFVNDIIEQKILKEEKNSSKSS